jgi:hypothetical protein
MEVQEVVSAGGLHHSFDKHSASQAAPRPARRKPGI